ncbi:hypothetical protein BHE74_00040072 [Ensete ventricosum]|nr:hypothetical protein BHE74_00040072 [Ensete ventricosum]
MESSSGGGGGAPGIHRQDIQAAIVTAAELRALHAALRQGSTGGSPAVVRLPAGASPSVSCGANQLAVPEDYPVFTPVSSCGSLDSALAPLPCEVLDVRIVL